MLSDAEVSQFKHDGFLAKRGIIEQNYCATARERLWDDPPPSLRKDDPNSWIGPIKPNEVSEDPDNFKKDYRWMYRKVGSEDWIVQGLPWHPFVQSTANQLLGKDRFTQRDRVRGIYCTLPRLKTDSQPRYMHIDDGQFTLGFVCYVDTVEPDGGGFAVWPGSHRRLFYTSHSRYRKESTDKYDRIRKEYDNSWETTSFQTHGEPGDIVIWHHRMAHMGSHNYSTNIRKAILTDFSFKNINQLAELPPGEDMWEDWGDAVRDIEE
jgi:hypothetical protein